MRTRFAFVLGTLLMANACGAGNDKARTAPTADFVEAAPNRHIDKSLVASPDADNRIAALDVVTFQHDQALLDEMTLSQVDTAARWLKDHPDQKVVLEGHADASGVAPYNEDLAMRRISAVRQRLMRQGVPGERIIAVNFGDREAMDEDNPLFGADRRVVMYATQLAPRAVAAIIDEEGRPAVAASWVENGALMELRNGLETPTRTVVGRR